MKLSRIQGAVVKAQAGLEAARLVVLESQQRAQTAKGQAQQLKREHKRARKAAKQAKRLVAEARERLSLQCKALSKAEHRLAKALKALAASGAPPVPSRRLSQTPPAAPRPRQPGVVPGKMVRPVPASRLPRLDSPAEHEDLPLPQPFITPPYSDSNQPVAD